ncbi:MAG: hypothetical protein MK135_15935 [Polyangiaceae bacterium]|nr:hypothetical protein [Polyangiaceae bacterium]
MSIACEECPPGESCFGEFSASGGSSNPNEVLAGGAPGEADTSAAGMGGMSLGGQSNSETLDSDAAQDSIDCHVDGVVQGTPGDASPTVDMGDPDYECQACAQELCASEMQDCYAYGPDSTCVWGTRTDTEELGGEIACMLNCFTELDDLGEFAFSELDVQECAERCGSSECAGSASSITQAAAACLINADGQGSSSYGCAEECAIAVIP